MTIYLFKQVFYETFYELFSLPVSFAQRQGRRENAHARRHQAVAETHLKSGNRSRQQLQPYRNFEISRGLTYCFTSVLLRICWPWFQPAFFDRGFFSPQKGQRLLGDPRQMCFEAILLVATNSVGSGIGWDMSKAMKKSDKIHQNPMGFSRF